MKKSLIALAVLAASGAAMAQSSVTLYGVADAGVTFVDGASNWTGLTSGNQLISRIGFQPHGVDFGALRSRVYQEPLQARTKGRVLSAN